MFRMAYLSHLNTQYCQNEKYNQNRKFLRNLNLDKSSNKLYILIV